MHRLPKSRAQKAEHDEASLPTARQSRNARKRSRWRRCSACPGFDDESNRAFAAKLGKYAGYRSVPYRGKGVFDVDYHFEGRATQDFVFPAFPDNDLLIPFIAMRRRADGVGARSPRPRSPEGRDRSARALGRRPQAR